MGVLWDLFSTPAEDERRALLDALGETRRALNRAYAGFDRAEHPELVESYIYEINALEHRYSYLQQQLRLQNREEEGAAAN